MKDVVIFMPAYNNATTIEQTLESINKQQTDKIERIIILDDGSSDNTREIIHKFMKKSKFRIELRNNIKSSGLAYKYNSIIKEIPNRYLLIVHADIIIESFHGIEVMIEDIKKEHAVAAIGQMKHRFVDWKTYHFWQKVEFDSLVYNSIKGNYQRILAGKCDLFDLSTLKKIGGFNEKTYYIAGEDLDMFFRLKKIGKIVSSNVVYAHIHSLEKNYSLKKFFLKSFRYSQGSGVLLRNYGFVYLSYFPLAITTPLIALIIVIGILLLFLCSNYPFLFFGLLLLIIYIILNTRLTFKHYWKDNRIFVLPFILFLKIFIGGYYFLKGLITNEQTI